MAYGASFGFACPQISVITGWEAEYLAAHSALEVALLDVPPALVCGTMQGYVDLSSNIEVWERSRWTGGCFVIDKFFSSYATGGFPSVGGWWIRHSCPSFSQISPSC